MSPLSFPLFLPICFACLTRKRFLAPRPILRKEVTLKKVFIAKNAAPLPPRYTPPLQEVPCKFFVLCSNAQVGRSARGTRALFYMLTSMYVASIYKEI
nr:MAG TPA: hypothetical protein [Caudoviricetes sp.]